MMLAMPPVSARYTIPAGSCSMRPRSSMPLGLPLPQAGELRVGAPRARVTSRATCTSAHFPSGLRAQVECACHGVGA
eukprot:CAMPEP_0182909866 /NCGR_PEP_ID=MMETSP0034_2-20130328/35993_1 /TAXON_ID=156128 /ORGANISM="Nephroselmis pyriformis, Strain CCMP717" /LENGTH=76 /DNA_ID=CAMNT_0025046151 /DNA_START=1 /DNA_END=231 /DNA_ORIENTATION=-